MKRTMMGRWTRVWAGLPLIAVFAMGCAQGGATDTGSSEGVARSPIAGDGGRQGERHGRGRRGPGGHGGPLHLARVALHALDLTEGQRTTIEASLADVKSAKHAGPKGGHDKPAAFAALAEGVRAGRVDEAAVLAEVEDREGPPAEMLDSAAAVLQTLHATLTPAQRQELVSLAAPPADAERERGPRGAEGKPRTGERGEHARGAAGHLLRGVDLTDEQRAKVDAAFAALEPSDAEREATKAERAAHRAETEARLRAFAADRFDAKAFVAPPARDREGGPRAHLARMVRAVAAIVPVLDGAQREVLAKNLESGPMHHGKGGKGKGGRRGEHGPSRGGPGPAGVEEREPTRL